MREIKFRTWDKTDKKMQFDRAIDEDGFPCVLLSDEHINCPAEIIMQFTGLRDRNNRDIYEGDIVTYDGFVVRGVVKYGRYKRQPFMNQDSPHENIGFYIKGVPEKFHSGLVNSHEYSLIQDNNVIIIGNKFEHPELLVVGVKHKL